MAQRTEAGRQAGTKKKKKRSVSPRDIRRAGFAVLYQLDARDGQDLEDIRAYVEELEGMGQAAQKKVLLLATNAWNKRDQADAVTSELAPDWPAHRQAAVDRAILRLAHYEMTQSDTPPKVVVNEAVDLAKAFSTEKSPAFINALLDKVLKRVLASSPGQTDAADVSSTGDQLKDSAERT